MKTTLEKVLIVSGNAGPKPTPEELADCISKTKEIFIKEYGEPIVFRYAVHDGIFSVPVPGSRPGILVYFEADVEIKVLTPM